VLRPPRPLCDRLALRIAAETGEAPVSPPRRPVDEEWEDALGISVTLLATGAETGGVSMLVRLATGTDYPPHVHAGVEELRAAR